MKHRELGIVVDELLDAGKPPIVDIHQADDVASGRAHRVDPPIFLDEVETGLAELVNLFLLPGRELAPDAYETASVLEFLAELSCVDVRKHACHLLDQFVDIDDLLRIGVKGRSLDVGRKQPAVAVDNVGPVNCRRDVTQTSATRPASDETERHETAANQHESQRESQAGEAKAIPAAREISAFGSGRCGVPFG
jgi:hypothetical protein